MKQFRIGIDARLYGNKDTGIGRYVRSLIINLGKVDKKNQYFIFGGEDIKNDISAFSNFHFVKLTTRIYTVLDQLVNPFVFSSQKLDILHVPHLSAPIFYQGKILLTLHDLIKHYSVGPETSTLPAPVYWLKHLVYKLVTNFNLNRASHIITPTKYWKNKIISDFHVQSEKVTVTYEAVDSLIKDISDDKTKEEILNHYHLRQPYLVYTGNLYPHKNVPFLINALEEFNKKHEHQLQLGIISARGNFKNIIKENDLVRFLGFVPDRDISAVYQDALALVQPSLIEGFGLTGLEAMSIGTPVLSSNATCLPEVYQQAALYFDPKDQEDLVHKLEVLITNHAHVARLIEEGKRLVKRYSWYKMAKETAKIYQTVCELP